MKLFKDYKGVMLIYLVITIINVVWMVNYEKPNDNKRVQNENSVTMSEKISY